MVNINIMDKYNGYQSISASLEKRMRPAGPVCQNCWSSAGRLFHFLLDLATLPKSVGKELHQLEISSFCHMKSGAS